MIDHLPIWINILFIATVVAVIGFLYFANSKPKKLVLLIIVWSIAHSVLAYFGFYQNLEAIPPRFALVLIPATLVICYSLLPQNIDKQINSRHLQLSTFIHTLRIPVEIILLQLFTHDMIPELMTFEGRNFDILAGISAPLIGFLFYKEMIGKKLLLIWNIVGLLLVIFIFLNGMLSAELPFQMFAFDQPNRAILYFPFILLPSTIVPIIIWTHMTDIIKLKTELKNEKS